MKPSTTCNLQLLVFRQIRQVIGIAHIEIQIVVVHSLLPLVDVMFLGVDVPI